MITFVFSYHDRWWPFVMYGCHTGIFMFFLAFYSLFRCLCWCTCDLTLYFFMVFLFCTKCAGWITSSYLYVLFCLVKKKKHSKSSRANSIRSTKWACYKSYITSLLKNMKIVFLWEKKKMKIVVCILQNVMTYLQNTILTATPANYP